MGGNVRSNDKLLFKLKILRHTQFLDDKVMHVDSYIFPHTRSEPNSKCYPWRRNYGFLYTNTTIQVNTN